MATAQLRNEAREMEAKLDWKNAAILYRRAIAVYPCKGALAALDIANMTNKAIGCESMEAY